MASSPPAKPPPADTGDVALEALWQRVVDAWDDDKTHAAILEYALRTEHLPEVAGRYRALKEDPAKAERVEKRLNAIVVAATELMMSMKTPARTKVPLPITLSAFAIFLLALVFVAYALFRR